MLAKDVLVAENCINGKGKMDFVLKMWKVKRLRTYRMKVYPVKMQKGIPLSSRKGASFNCQIVKIKPWRPETPESRPSASSFGARCQVNQLGDFLLQFHGCQPGLARLALPIVRVKFRLHCRTCIGTCFILFTCEKECMLHKKWTNLLSGFLCIQFRNNITNVNEQRSYFHSAAPPSFRQLSSVLCSVTFHSWLCAVCSSLP